MSAAGPQDGWPRLADRTDDPRIRRARRHRAAIAVVRRLSRGRSYQFLRVLSINRRLFRPFLALNARLMPFGRLDRDQTEALILRTALLCGSRYEWTQHVALARRAGLGDEQIEAVRADPGSELLSEPTRALLTIVPELLDRHRVGEQTHGRLARHFGPDDVLEAIMLVGNYAMLAGALNSFGVALERAWDLD